MPAAVGGAVLGLFGVSSATAGAAAVVGGVTIASSWAALTGGVILTGASVAYSASQASKMRKSMRASTSSSVDQGRKVMVRDPLAARRYIYGQVPVSGPLIYIGVSGTNKEYLHLVIALASHECEELGEIKFGDTVVPLSGTAATGTYADYVRIKKFLGIAAGERDTDLETESGGEWTLNHLGKGIARLHVRLKYSADLFPEGIPAITCMVKGRKVFDPRDGTQSSATPSTWKWSQNAALCIADFLHDTMLGKGVAWARIRSAELTAAANVCDESVTLDDLSTEKRYAINGTVDAGDPESTLLEMTAAMQGHLCDAGGLWTINAGAYRSPILDLGEDDLLSELDVTPRMSRQDTFNGVRGTFISAINQWSAADFVPIKNATYMGWDGGVRLWKDVSYNFTTSSPTAQRIAKIELERGRQQISVSGVWKLKALKCQPGNNIRLTDPDMGWTNKVFEVVSWSFDISGEELGVAMELRETASGVWDWANGEETTVDLAPNTTLYNPRAVAAATSLILASGTDHLVKKSDGTIISRIRVSWALPSDQFVQSGGFTEVQYKKAADSDWIDLTTVPGSSGVAYIDGVDDGVSYDVRVRSINSSGVHSAWLTSTGHVVVGKTAAPAVPSSFTATGLSDGIFLKWTNPADIDLAHVEVFETTSGGAAPGSSSTPHTKTDSAHYFRGGLDVGAVRDYYIRSVDRSGNKSAWVGPASATTSVGGADTGAPGAPSSATITAGLGMLFIEWTNPSDSDLRHIRVFVAATAVLPGTPSYITASDFYALSGLGNSVTRYFWLQAEDLAGNLSTVAGPFSGTTRAGIDLSDIVSGMTMVEIVGTLPTADNFEGRTVMLTTDGKLYRWYGAAWTKAVGAADVTGTLTNAQIADLAATKITGQLTNAQLADIASTKITGTLTSAQIADLAATKITGQITGTQITDDAVTAAKIFAGAVTTAKLAAGAVTADEIATNAVTAVKVLAGAITTGKIAAGAVTADEIASNAVTAAKVLAGAITTGKIAAGAVTADEIATNAITALKISAGAVETDKIAANAITAGTIAAGAITAAAVGANEIIANTANIKDAIIAGAKIADLAVGTLKVANNAITLPATNTRSTPTYTGDNTWKEINAVEYDLTYATKALILANITQGYTSATGHEARIKVDTVVVASGGGDAVNDYPTMHASVDLAAGEHDVTVEWKGSTSAISTTSNTLSILGTMK